MLRHWVVRTMMPEQWRQLPIFQSPHGANKNAMIPGVHRALQFALEGGDGASQQRDAALSLVPEDLAEAALLSGR
jgi:hypothetical protein